MGGFLLIIVATLIALFYALMPGQQDSSSAVFTANKPAVQAVAANMVEFHRAAVDFVSLSVNRNPASQSWAFSFQDQTAVRCPTYSGGLYPANSVGGNCTAGTATELRVPSFMSQLYNWRVYYYSDGAGGAQDIVVTYAAAATDQVGGYTSAEVRAGLADYSLASEGWYWGVTETVSPYTLSNGTTTLTLPLSFAVPSVVAIATVIP